MLRQSLIRRIGQQDVDQRASMNSGGCLDGVASEKASCEYSSLSHVCGVFTMKIGLPSGVSVAAF